MSYILDALQRAEQERQRKSGTVPGLQTRTLPVPLEASGSNQFLVGRWTIFALVLVSAAIAATLVLWRKETPVATTTNAPVVSTTLAQTASVTTAAPVAIPPLQRAASSSKPTPAPVKQIEPVVAASTPVALPLLKDMAEDFRSQVPPLVISGVVYSENPAQRLLLVNGQVLSQGSRAAADLTLDEIQPTASNFTFRGTRFKLNH